MKRFRGKIVIPVILAVALCAGGTYYFVGWNGGKSKGAAAAQVATVKVQKGNLRSVISGTGQLTADQLQEIVPPKEGMIKVINLSRNQPVKKGDLLLEVADPATEEKLVQERLNLASLENDLADLRKQAASLRTIAPVSGKLMLSANLSEGASVSTSTKIGSIAQTDALTLTLPFLQEEASQMKAGDSVQLEIDGFMLAKVGKIDSISLGANSDSKGNRLMNVKISVANDGTLDSGLKTRGSVTLAGVKVESKGQAELQYSKVTPVMSNTSGTIKQMVIQQDGMVKAGDLICVIENDKLPLQVALKEEQVNAQVKSLEDLQSQLDKLKVYAPFDGVFSADFANQKKNVLSSYPVGTTIENNVALGSVANLDNLQLPIQVDELDITKVKTGMKVEIAVDAVSGKKFIGEVTQVSNVGVVTNGVTFYDVVITVKNTADLKYAMTATADIIVEDKKDVLMLPIEALRRQGGKQVVSVKKADGSVEQREVKSGVSNSTHVEIVSGLNEGDEVLTGSGSAQKLTQEQIQQMRQQFQQGGRNGGTPGAAGGGGGGFPGGAAGGGNSNRTTGGSTR